MAALFASGVRAPGGTWGETLWQSVRLVSRSTIEHDNDNDDSTRPFCSKVMLGGVRAQAKCVMTLVLSCPLESKVGAPARGLGHTRKKLAVDVRLGGAAFEERDMK